MKLPLALLSTLLLAPLAFADITLIREGQPQVVIIVPDGLYSFDDGFEIRESVA